jgi:hypothetical protein
MILNKKIVENIIMECRDYHLPIIEYLISIGYNYVYILKEDFNNNIIFVYNDFKKIVNIISNKKFDILFKYEPLYK